MNASLRSSDMGAAGGMGGALRLLAGGNRIMSGSFCVFDASEGTGLSLKLSKN